jgi:hypothetical protein
MSGGTISGNSATWGGGVYIGSYSSSMPGMFSMNGGTVTGNSATTAGTAVLIDGGSYLASNYTKFTVTPDGATSWYTGSDWKLTTQP